MRKSSIVGTPMYDDHAADWTSVFNFGISPFGKMQCVRRCRGWRLSSDLLLTCSTIFDEDCRSFMGQEKWQRLEKHIRIYFLGYRSDSKALEFIIWCSYCTAIGDSPDSCNYLNTQEESVFLLLTTISGSLQIIRPVNFNTSHHCL